MQNPQQLAGSLSLVLSRVCWTTPLSSSTGVLGQSSVNVEAPPLAHQQHRRLHEFLSRNNRAASDTPTCLRFWNHWLQKSFAGNCTRTPDQLRVMQSRLRQLAMNWSALSTRGQRPWRRVDSGRAGGHLGEHVLVPDLAGWCRERLPKILETAYFELALDWVCEVLSPSTARTDRVLKLPIYVEFGVAHC